MRKFLVALCWSCVALNSSAHATLISVNASDFADGVNTTNAFNGVTIQGVSGRRENGVPVITHAPTFVTPIMAGSSDTGLRAFGAPGLGTSFSPLNFRSGGLGYHFAGLGLDCSECDAIRIDLDAPTDYLKIFAGTTGDQYEPTQSVIAYFYDADWNLLDSCYSLQGTGCATVGSSTLGRWTVDMEYSTTLPLISHIIAGGETVGFVRGLAYNSIPEPGTATLLGCGLLGLMLTRSRALRAQKTKR